MTDYYWKRPSAPPVGDLPLFSPAAEVAAPTVATAIAEGMTDAEDGASLRWLALARDCVAVCAAVLPQFTTDDVWAALERSGRDIIESERNPSAIGVVMLAAKRAGTIRKVEGVTVTSTRPSRHGQLLRVWTAT
jgi:hypothetical protein